jgi:hypothetical protein
MTDAITITPGQKFGGGCFEVLSLDPSAKRRCVSCSACSGVHIVGVEALVSGSVACLAMPLTRDRAASMRVEADEIRRQRRLDLKNWRPGDRT